MTARFNEGSTADTADTAVRTTRITRSLAVRGTIDDTVEIWNEHRDEILAGVSASTATLRPGIDQGHWGITFALTLTFDSIETGREPALLANKALRRLKTLAETRSLAFDSRRRLAGSVSRGLPA